MGDGMVGMGELIIITMMAGGMLELIKQQGGIAKQIGDRYGVDNKKAASILDTCSCFVQGVIPYGAQLLIAAGLATINPVSIMPYLFYPFAIGMATFLSILFRYPRRYS